MWLLRSLLFRWLWDRLSGRRDQRGYGNRFRGSQPGRYAGFPSSRRAQRQGRVGFFGPLPYYSTRTRGGSRVAVSGCCLPLALALTAVPVLALRAAVRRF
jgi:hypothetical protein